MHERGHPLLEPVFDRHLRGVLRRRRMPPEWLDDAVGEVIVRTLEAVDGREPPADAGEWHALATTVALHYAADERKKARRRERLGNAGPCEDADVFEPLEDDTWWHWLDAKTIAEELTLSEAAVRGRLKRMRKKFCDLVDERGLSHLPSRQEEREDSERSDAAAA